MTNQQSIQQKHLEAINGNVKATCDTGVKNFIATGTDLAATSCTTITAEAIGEAMEWAAENNWKYDNSDRMWFIPDFNQEYNTTDLVQLFLNQKAKI